MTKKTDDTPPKASIEQSVAPATAPTPKLTPQLAGSGRFVLQWLTYAFWGWAVALLALLTEMVIGAVFFDKLYVTGTPYVLAGLLVLVPLAFVCDHFYSKYERRERSNGETIIVSVHAILFAIIGIAALIGLAFNVVRLLLPDHTNNIALSIITSAVTALLFGLTFLRTLNPKPFEYIQKYYRYIILILAVILTIGAITGPLRDLQSREDDKLIRQNISRLSADINDYARDNDELPRSLSALDDSNTNVQKLIDSGLVEYKREGVLEGLSRSYRQSRFSPSEYHGYQLCVTYNDAAPSSRYRTTNESSMARNSDAYQTSPSAYNHPKGDVCYKIRVSLPIDRDRSSSSSSNQLST